MNKFDGFTYDELDIISSCLDYCYDQFNHNFAGYARTLDEEKLRTLWEKAWGEFRFRRALAQPERIADGYRDDKS